MLSKIFSLSFLTSLIAGTIRLATPILIPALGQVLTQRAGVLNLSVEGCMLMGAVCGFSAASISGNLWIGLLCGIGAGILFSFIMAWLSVTVRANQVIAGIGLNIFATGLAAYVYRVVFGIRSLPEQIETFPTLSIPGLSSIPVIGTIFFQHNWIVYFAFFILLPFTFFVLEKTTFGLAIKAVGENPRAADSKGINVGGVRYAAVLIGGAYAGFGGAFMTLAYLNSYTDSVIGGRGYIAVSVVILARFLPQRAMWGALLFGFASALQLRFQAMGVPVPSQILLMLPYVATIIALVFASRKAHMPRAYAVPYSRMER